MVCFTKSKILWILAFISYISLPPRVKFCCQRHSFVHGLLFPLKQWLLLMEWKKYVNLKHQKSALFDISNGWTWSAYKCIIYLLFICFVTKYTFLLLAEFFIWIKCWELQGFQNLLKNFSTCAWDHSPGFLGILTLPKNICQVCVNWWSIPFSDIWSWTDLSVPFYSVLDNIDKNHRNLSPYPQSVTLIFISPDSH